ncbi:MAG: hypothetical protein RL030_502 [Pseudomonadota bacterium]
MKLPVLLALLFAAPLAAAAQQPSGVERVRAATAEWVDAFNRKDSAAITALYASDAVLFGTSSPVLRNTPALIADYFRTLPDLGDAVITVGRDHVQLLGDTAIHTGYYTRSAAQDGRLVQNPARFTFVYAWREGRWRIVNHHSSAMP